jgi:hypothetical protein
MGRKVKLLSDHDIAEVEMFRQFLGDLHSNMEHFDFAKKWGDYMGLTPLAAEAYSKWKRTTLQAATPVVEPAKEGK